MVQQSLHLGDEGVQRNSAVINMQIFFCLSGPQPFSSSFKGAQCGAAHPLAKVRVWSA